MLSLSIRSFFSVISGFIINSNLLFLILLRCGLFSEIPILRTFYILPFFNRLLSLFKFLYFWSIVSFGGSYSPSFSYRVCFSLFDYTNSSLKLFLGLIFPRSINMFSYSFMMISFKSFVCRSYLDSISSKWNVTKLKKFIQIPCSARVLNIFVHFLKFSLLFL